MGLRVGDDGVAPGDSRPAAGVDVQGQEPAGLRGGGVEVAVPGHGEPCGVVLLGHPHLGATPVTVGSEHRAKLLRLALALGAQCAGGEAFPERFARGQRPRPEHLDCDRVVFHRLPSPGVSRLVVDGDGVAVGLGEGEGPPERGDGDRDTGLAQLVVQGLGVIGVQPQRHPVPGPRRRRVQVDTGQRFAEGEGDGGWCRTTAPGGLAGIRRRPRRVS